MEKIKFGTDGWRAILDTQFTVDNVARVTIAVEKWISENESSPTVVVGHDCRRDGELFAVTVAKVLLNGGVKVKLAKGYVSTPMVSLGVVEEKAQLGIIITASHNPANYNGYKIKASYGGPLLLKNIEEIEAIIPDENSIDLDSIVLDTYLASGQMEYVDLETMYCDHVKNSFDLEAIKNSGINIAFDAMYGSGQNVLERVLPGHILLHCEHDDTFKGQAPEPIDKNLQELSQLVKNDANIHIGLATDGDADRIGLYDSDGDFVDSHHIILLLVSYFYDIKGLRGDVCTTFSTTSRVKTLCDQYGLRNEVVKIGFKYVCEVMLENEVLVGGEESGGIAVTGHILERDGIWIGLVLIEYMAKTGKSLQELIQEVYAKVGSFAYERNDLHLEESVKLSIIEKCRNEEFKSFGSYVVNSLETLDGFKYFFDNGETLLIRPSGTEPVLRTYAESKTKEASFALLDAVEKELLGK
ncbi:MAG: phosphoglucomutase/phosphomannomutase family protein [Flavobacteriales bacterium]|nr:phosphoglucomutase/phosphomannomutase family protein [Flavobacteriales bacterium]